MELNTSEKQEPFEQKDQQEKSLQDENQEIQNTENKKEGEEKSNENQVIFTSNNLGLEKETIKTEENKEVIEFQELIKTDIGTSLDIPTAPFVTREKAEEDLEITLQRAREAIEYKNSQNMEMKLNSVVQGSTFPDLRRYCADELTKLDADLYPIGAVVPLMESYHYKDLVDVVMNSVAHLPDNKPRHLMGAGHPMIFALAAAMGCDLFDSAAYILYAEDDRLLSTRGTYKLENLQEMPCSCEVCTKYTPDDLRAMDKKERRDLIKA